MPESCSTAELVELNCLPNLIQKFDSDAVLLPCFCRSSDVLNLVRHGRSTASELGLSLKKLFVYVTITSDLGSEKFVLASESNLSLATGLAS